MIGAELLRIPQSFATQLMMCRANHHDPFFRYLSTNEFGGRITEVSKSQANFTASHQVAHLKAVRSAQFEARFLVPGREAPQLFHDGRACKSSHNRKRNRAMIFALQGLHRLASVLDRREYGLRIGKECTPCFGEHGAAPPSFE